MTRLRVAVLAVVLVGVIAGPAQAGDYIVVLKDSANEPAVAADHTKKGAKVSQHYKHALKGYAAKLSDSQLAAVRTDSRVRFIASDTRVQATAVSCTDYRPPLIEASAALRRRSYRRRSQQHALGERERVGERQRGRARHRDRRGAGD